MRRLTFFIKGNVDVHDSLHSCRIGGKLAWNGINEVLQASHPNYVARVKHETFTRSDALLRATGVVPDLLSSRSLPLGVYSASSQFSQAIFDTKVDVIVLSIQSDVVSGLMRHRKEGFLFYAADARHWSEADRRWLKDDCEPVGTLEVAESMATFAFIIERIRRQSAAPILIYNMSPITPGETIHCYQGIGETYSNRIRKFNLGLVGLSESSGISIIDVDSLLARSGADHHKIDTMHLTAAGYRLVAEEVVRVLADMGVLEDSGS